MAGRTPSIAIAYEDICEDRQGIEGRGVGRFFAFRLSARRSLDSRAGWLAMRGHCNTRECKSMRPGGWQISQGL